MPDTFIDIAKVTRSHIPTAYMLARLEIPNKGHNVAERDAATTLSGGVAVAMASKGRGGSHLVRLIRTKGRKGEIRHKPIH